MMNFTRSCRLSPTVSWHRETVENIKAAIDRVRYMSLDHVTSPEMLLRQHHEIFTALENAMPRR